jgi:hypothetical protein
VQRWVRNLDSELVHGFWLPAWFMRHYPNFVCQPGDGRVLVAEHKGEHLRNLPKGIDKTRVGRRWADRSAGQAVFAMLFKTECGMSVSQWINAALG